MMVKYIDGERVVSLLPMLKRYTKSANAEFEDEFKRTKIFEMSFNHGEVFVVKVLGEAKESTKGDKKMDVVVIARKGKPANFITGRDWTYNVGDTRWVRTYDLKKVGYYKM